MTAEIAAEIRDPSYRVNVSAVGIHAYNRDGMTTATDPDDLYPRLDLLQGDVPHASYLGVELGRAQIAWQPRQALCAGRALKWGSAARSVAGQDTASQQAYKPEGTILKAGKRRREVP